MPRYYFDTLDGEAIIDDEGETAADQASARDIAIRIVSEMTRSASRSRAEEPVFAVLRDEAKASIRRLTVTATRSPDARAGCREPYGKR